MSKLEKRLIIFAIIFVAVYIGAIVATLKSRPDSPQKMTSIESAIPTEEESRLIMAELILPMAVLATLSICFLLARKKRMKTYQTLDEPDGVDSQPDA